VSEDEPAGEARSGPKAYYRQAAQDHGAALERLAYSYEADADQRRTSCRRFIWRYGGVSTGLTGAVRSERGSIGLGCMGASPKRYRDGLSSAGHLSPSSVSVQVSRIL